MKFLPYLRIIRSGQIIHLFQIMKETRVPIIQILRISPNVAAANSWKNLFNVLLVPLTYR